MDSRLAVAATALLVATSGLGCSGEDSPPPEPPFDPVALYGMQVP